MPQVYRISSARLRRPLDAERIAAVRRRLTAEENAAIDKMQGESGRPVIDFWNFLRTRAGHQVSASRLRQDPLTIAWRAIDQALAALDDEEQATAIANEEARLVRTKRIRARRHRQVVSPKRILVTITAIAKAAISEGEKLDRDELVQRTQADLNCDRASARAAFRKLPEELRKQAGKQKAAK
jgi:hypothetical protein